MRRYIIVLALFVIYQNCNAQLHANNIYENALDYLKKSSAIKDSLYFILESYEDENLTFQKNDKLLFYVSPEVVSNTFYFFSRKLLDERKIETKEKADSLYINYLHYGTTKIDTTLIYRLKSDIQSPLILFFSEPFLNFLTVDIFHIHKKSPYDSFFDLRRYNNVSGFNRGLTILFCFNEKGSIEDVYISKIYID